MKRYSKKNLTYAEKLRDPRWQRLREKVLNAWGNACHECREKEKPLQVHHRFYESGKEPWDYGINDMVVLCKQCHLKRHAVELRIQKIIGKLRYSDLCKLAKNLEHSPTAPKPEKEPKQSEAQKHGPLFKDAGDKMFDALKDSLDDE